MGANLHSGVGGRLGKNKPGRRRRTRKNLMSEINVTPFVDVMLVLLIIFMVAAPMMTVGIKVDLPDAESPPLEGKDEPLTVTIKKDGKVYLQETQINLNVLGPKLDAITKRKHDTRIFIRGDEAVDYGKMMQVMSTISKAGFTKIGLMSDPAKGG